MDLDAALRRTGAVRRFTDEPVARRTVHAILDAARFAPSGGNRQPWRVAVVEDRDLRTRMAALMQPVWDEYMAAGAGGQRAFNPVSYTPPSQAPPSPNELLDGLAAAPVVLAVAVDLREIALMDGGLDRAPVVGGASIYPFCWSILLAAHEHGLGGVMTTFLSRAEPDAAPLLGLPEHHGLAATIVLGVPVGRATRLNRRPVESFTTIDRFDGTAFDPGAPDGFDTTDGPSQSSRPTVERAEPRLATDERTTLVEFLTYYRDTLELKAAGLTDQQASRAAVPPSDLSLMGLIRHMADVERNWFERVLAGKDRTTDPDAAPIYYGAAHPSGDPDGDLHPGAADTLDEAISTWRREIARSDDAMAGLPLDHLSVGDTGDERVGPPNLRWILVHLVEEYARHCGHADLLRQAIDGSVGD